MSFTGDNGLKKILYLTAESSPYSKVGGLGDVSGSLPPILADLYSAFFDIRMVMPFHKNMNTSNTNIKKLDELVVEYANTHEIIEVFQDQNAALPVYFLKSPSLSSTPPYTDNLQVDLIKYCLFSKAIHSFCDTINFLPDLYHANDWHTALAVYQTKTIAFKKNRKSPFSTILSIHNLPYMGNANRKILRKFGFRPSRNLSLPKWARDLPLPMGISRADQILTVSNGYAQELLTPEFGCGLHTYLQKKATKVAGILNGIDQTEWDPASDHFLAQNYTIDNLDQRMVNKKALFDKYFPGTSNKTPLLIWVGRLTGQKGADVLLDSLNMLLDQDWRCIILGTGDPALEKAIRTLANKVPEKIVGLAEFSNELAHKLYAGGDMIIMPSRYEPCGLSQMFAMRYGCLAVATATGGLKDTIKDYSSTENPDGFLFTAAKANDCSKSIALAMHVYQDNPGKWRQMQIDAMRKDFSWHRSAERYKAMYLKLLERHS
ncbi:MAG: glycogen synthase [Anaerolineaceae bacterium]|nr:glycogen synthase [Anaerolineaceae bacterium]